MFSDIVADVASLIFPRTCPVCGEPLPRRGGVVCPMCEITAPLTNLWLEALLGTAARGAGIGILLVC